MSPPEIVHLPAADHIADPAPSIEHLAEPFLRFGQGQLHVDPKAGIGRYGPWSYGTPLHRDVIRLGIVGTAELSAQAQTWLGSSARGVRGDISNPSFPGFLADRGFFASLTFDETWDALITQTELAQVLKISRKRRRFEETVRLIGEKIKIIAERDQPPDCILLVLSDELVRRSGVAEFVDRDLGTLHRDLRRAIKALAMKHGMPTQLLRQQVLDGRDATAPSKIAWNLFTGLFHKGGGCPWMPTGLSADTCYAGISFYRPPGSRYNRLQTSLVQAFDGRGDSLILRGREFEWDPEREGSAAPHLNEDQSAQLISLVLNRYEKENGRLPSRVVIQKTSRYWAAERAGFAQALADKVPRFDLLALDGRQSHVRLIAASKYPPLRGTRFTIGELDFLYTTGFIPALNEFHGMHVPSPLLIADHIGQDTPRLQLLSEILALTKLNWNSAGFGGKLPVTLRFAELVGAIMKEVLPDQEPRPQFKFYI